MCLCVCHSVHCTFECAQTLCSHCIKIMHREVFFPLDLVKSKFIQGKCGCQCDYLPMKYLKKKNANNQQNSRNRFRSFLNFILVNNNKEKIMYYSFVQLIIQRLQSILIIRLGKSTRRSNKMVISMNEA